jgi:RNA polymerase sigma factor (TIGR02999 family)
MGRPSSLYTFAAKLMRMLLIDHARENLAQSRGGGVEHIPLHENLPWVHIGSADLLELNRALDELGRIDPHKVQLVEWRYFLGYTVEETAELLRTSKATVEREMKFVKSWLFSRLHPEAVGEVVNS